MIYHPHFISVAVSRFDAIPQKHFCNLLCVL